MAAEPLPLPTASQAVTTVDSNDTTDTAVWLGALFSGLALLGLAGVAGAAIRRRKKVHDVRDIRIERPVIDHNGLPLGTKVAPTAGSVNPEPRAQLAAAPLVASASTAAFAAPRTYAPQYGESSYQAHSGAAVALPRERPATREARRELIERLAAAEPDRANPFRTPKARLRRAKLIEQSIGRTFPGGKSRIDLSQYPMNWPELALRRPAAA